MTRKIKSEARLAKLNKIITKALATTVSNEALNEITSSVISESLTNDEIAYTASELEDTITAILIEKVVKIKALQLNLKSNAEKGKVAVIDSSSELSHIKGLIIRDADKLQQAALDFYRYYCENHINTSVNHESVEAFINKVVKEFASKVDYDANYLDQRMLLHSLVDLSRSYIEHFHTVENSTLSDPVVCRPIGDQCLISITLSTLRLLLIKYQESMKSQIVNSAQLLKSVNFKYLVRQLAIKINGTSEYDAYNLPLSFSFWENDDTAIFRLCRVSASETDIVIKRVKEELAGAAIALDAKNHEMLNSLMSVELLIENTLQSFRLEEIYNGN